MALVKYKEGNTDLKYRQVMTAIESDILKGKYTYGRKLPTIRQMAKEYDYNILTIQKALQKLENRGLVELRQGSGTYVAYEGRKTLKIGLAFRKRLVDIDKNHPILGIVLAGAHRQCDDSNVRVQTFFYSDHNFISEVGKFLLADGIDAVVVVGGGLDKQDDEFLKANGIYSACYNAALHKGEWSMPIVLNLASALRKLIERFRMQGHRNIGFVCWSAMGDDGLLHREFTSIAYDFQMDNVSKLLLKVDNYDGYIHWENIENLFDIEHFPSAVVVFDEFLADALLVACGKRNIDIPDDLSISVLHDALPYNHLIPLTSAFGPQEIGEAIQLACGELIGRCHGKEFSRKMIAIDPNIIVKASSGIPKNRD